LSLRPEGPDGCRTSSKLATSFGPDTVLNLNLRY
jgi:hypothetical protein